jgi:catechol 2,3-dioxygenase-like lactoylglutathione lyase family enzyme
VELVVKPGENEAFYKQIEVGLTVSNVEASRAFYRDFMGLEELEPVHDARYNTMKYTFRLGNTTISLRSFGGDLPADTGSGGIQYVVSDAVAVDVLAKRRGVTIDQPLSILDGFNMYFLWLEDPDGITNYFAQVNAVPQKE